MAASSNDSNTVWRVEFNQETCSLCEVCVRGCPTHALLVRVEGLEEEILFDERLCDGCGGKPFCQEQCPEAAATVSQVSGLQNEGRPVALVRGQLSVCSTCSAPFMPERKLKTLLQKEKISPKGVQAQCPACRRENLVDSYLRITKQIP